jgi:hypothetical protein
MLTPHERALRAITEAKFQSDVEAMMKLFGWLHYHAPDNKPINGRLQNIVPGFPDLCAVRGTRLLFAELKTELGTVSPAQERWAGALRTAGIEYYLWRPRDMQDIQNVLASPTRL